MKMKKTILYIAVLAICLSLITGGTIAYYTGSDTARNVITTGAVEVAVRDQQLVGGVLQPTPPVVINAMPMATVSKIVSVESLQQTAWIRANFVVTVYDAQGNVMELSEEALTAAIVITPDQENWIFRDGWWYYNAAVSKGESTLPLFESVYFTKAMGNTYQNCSVTVDVFAQGVQKANNGTSALEALGWPEE